MNPINKFVNLFVTASAIALTFPAAPKLYHLTEHFMRAYIAENASQSLVDIGMIGWAVATALITFSSLQLVLFVLVANFITGSGRL